MRAVVRTEYGSSEVVRIAEVAKPVPTDREVLVRVVAASINGSDREGLSGSPFYIRIGGLRRPRHPILGSDIAGRVEQVGSRVRDLRPGDEVLGEVPDYHSGFADYACVPETSLVRKPEQLSFEEAAAIPQAGSIALQGICNEGRVGQGHRVLINGAGGAAGSFAVQLARLSGGEVTAVDHGDKADFLRSLGADHVIDYTRDDYTRTGEAFDLILDTIGHRSPGECARALRPRGTYLVVGGSTRVLLATVVLGPWIRRTTGRRVRVLVVPQARQPLLAVTRLCAERRIVPAIDRCYPVAEAREALRYVSEGRQRGKVVLRFDS